MLPTPPRPVEKPCGWCTVVSGRWPREVLAVLLSLPVLVCVLVVVSGWLWDVVREIGGAMRRMLPAPPMPVWVYERLELDVEGEGAAVRCSMVRMVLVHSLLALPDGELYGDIMCAAGDGG